MQFVLTTVVALLERFVFPALAAVGTVQVLCGAFMRDLHVKVFA